MSSPITLSNFNNIDWNQVLSALMQQESLPLQVLQSGDEIVGISNWETQEALVSYVDGDLARDLFTRLTPLLMGKPTTRSYEVRASA